MYKIMICDDEAIVINSLNHIIEKSFGAECVMESAKTGRIAIEKAEAFRPDIVFMDIQMPGINGIEAMEKMKERNPDMILIILSAYDRFQYAQKAIDLGVQEYLTKPVRSNKVVEVLQKAMSKIMSMRAKISQDLEIREKLETVLPMIEHGLIANIVLQDEFSGNEADEYIRLLDIRARHGFMMVMEYADKISNGGSLDNPVGASVRFQKCYLEVREIIKEYFTCFVGNTMANKIAVLVLHNETEMEYDERIQVIEKVRMLVRKLSQRTGLQYKMSIGSVREIDQISISYKEALSVLRGQSGKVSHVNDLPIGPAYDGNYPAETEGELFRAVKKGNGNEAVRLAGEFFEWMTGSPQQDEMLIKLKCMEFILRAEFEAYRHGGMIYSMDNRKGYLESLIGFTDYEALRSWYLDKLTQACDNIRLKRQQQSNSVIEKAKNYINGHFQRDLSLDEVSRVVGISPYYFSKLFKEEMGETFVEYVTRTRMEQARELLANPKLSIKEVCVRIGYGDPNYFSRIFKKWTGVTPTDYREGGILR